jgi:hypothetical protein
MSIMLLSRRPGERWDPQPPNDDGVKRSRQHEERPAAQLWPVVIGPGVRRDDVEGVLHHHTATLCTSAGGGA